MYTYPHGPNDTPPCAITGGTFYNPPVSTFPSSYVGDYFFADFCNGWVRRYDPTADQATGFATGLGSPVDMEVGQLGGLYVLVHGRPGRVVRIRFTG